MHWAASSVAALIRQQADWRQTLARKFPNDVRNTPAAAALDRLASFVERLPEVDPDLSRLVALDPFADDQSFHAGPSALKALGRFGYDPDASVALRAQLQDLISAVGEDRKRTTATWRPGVGTLRFDYPGRYIATYRGELVDVLSVVAVPQTPPEILRRPDGIIDVAIPRHFHSDTVRFRVRASSPLATLRGEHWVALADLDDVPRPFESSSAEPAPPFSERWPVSDVDGVDTYLWSHAPLEIGVVAKFELSARDASQRRFVGDFFEPAGGEGFRDVVVAVEPHFVPEMRFIRVVRLAPPTPDDPGLARGAAVRAYLDRCHRLTLTPSGWVNQIEPNWWGGMPLDEMIRTAASGPLAQAAADELWRRGLFKAGGEWVPHKHSGRGPGIAVGRGNVVRTRRSR